MINLEKYYKERNRLVCEGMDYIDACNQAWRTEIDNEKCNSV